VVVPSASPTLTVTIPAGTLGSTEVVSLDEIRDMIVLWPQAQEQGDSGVEWSFVEW
jgi:hypothetical protein